MWVERLFKNKTKVWVEVDDEGAYVLDGGRVPMRYSEDEDAKVYKAGAANLSDATGATPPPKKKKTKGGATVDELVWKDPVGPLVEHEEATSQAPYPDKVVVYTDGACSKNPGPCGYGLVIINGTQYLELSQYIGIGTNNIAELMAIKVALDRIDTSAIAEIHTDSSYAIGVITKNWKAKANKELVAELRRQIKTFDTKPTLIKVKGHAGIPLNERADELATGSIGRKS